LNTIPHIEQTVELLFRHEWGKLITVLTKLFGPQNLQLAEDVVQDTLVKALGNWKIHGLPQNPSGWLFAAARNRAIDILRQQKRVHQFSKDIAPLLGSEYTLIPTVTEIINTNTIEDDQLRMMFVCCHPSLSADAQVSLILKTLCGFSVVEIARAFVCSYPTIEKRLYRARQTFRENNVQFELPTAAKLNNRLENVLKSVYLLFNEGYNSTNHDTLIRNDLMEEAMRLCELICRSKAVQHSNTHALLSLMCFSASRNDARLDKQGNILLLQQQDRMKWNQSLIKKGIFHLEASASGTVISKYHLESGIAYEHATAIDYAHTNWQNILHYYNILCRNYPSPIAALNRAIIISEINGPADGIKAIGAIQHIEALKNYYLLPATLGQLHQQLGQPDIAKNFFEQAMCLTQSATEKKLLQQKIDQQ
jgi:RNA polymerase sigma factor (sigma-70 family)